MSYLANPVLYGTYAARPAVAPEGTLYKAKDSPFEYVMKNKSWQALAGSIAMLGVPAISNFTTTINAPGNTSANVTPSTFASYRDGLLFDAVMLNNDIRGAYQSVSGIGAYQLTVHFMLGWSVGNSISTSGAYSGAGIAWRASSSGNLHWLGLVARYDGSAPAFEVFFRQFTASGTGASSITYTTGSDSFTLIGAHHFGGGANGFWFRVVDDTINRYCFISVDGNQWNPIGSVARTSFITPDQVGIAVGSVSTSGGTVRPTTVFGSYQLVNLPSGTQQPVQALGTQNVLQGFRAPLDQPRILQLPINGNVMR